MLDRYATPEMLALWNEETKFKRWLLVELAVLKARYELGTLSKEAFQAIAEHASIDVERIHVLDKEYKHDLQAFVASVRESLVKADVGQFEQEVHKYMTSYDIEDPAFILLLRKAVDLIIVELDKLISTLATQAMAHRKTLMIARTHGQFAEPTVFGHLLLVYAHAMQRNKRRLETVLEHELAEGKISGAVGNYAGMNPRIEMLALKALDLKPAPAETQILQRDRHAMLFSVLAVTAASIEQMCRTFWEMMRSEVGELQEPRSEKQRGSSAMAHKRNPILTEQLQGMARLVRASAHAAIENVATPEGRDISQSCVERHIAPDATSQLHYMIRKMIGLVENLVVHPKRMLENLDSTMGVWAGQRIRNALMEAGISYDDAYAYVQMVSFEATDTRTPLYDLVCRVSSPMVGPSPRTVLGILGENALKKCFDVWDYISPGLDHLFRDLPDKPEPKTPA